MMIATGLAALCLGISALQTPELDTVLSRASDYVKDYERSLGMVIAREEYVQRAPVAGASSMPAFSDLQGNVRTRFSLEEQERRLSSDYMMVRLPGEGEEWVGFRAVIEVDGHPVPNRLERLEDVLAGRFEQAVEKWRKLSEESARYNIGPVNRNTNVPTFALLFLRSDYLERFEFEHTDTDRVEGVDVWVLSFREVATPTLVSNLRGNNVFMNGRLWIDPVDGRVVRTEVQTGDGNSKARSKVTVRYRPNAELLKERYEFASGRIEATAEYSDFQQFEVSVGTSLPK